MSVRGPISHIDLNVSNPRVSIPFYAVVLEYLGFHRFWVSPSEGRPSLGALSETDRCAWWITYESSAVLGIEIRPPREPLMRDRHERYAPGIDHIAFHAKSPEDVDGLYRVLIDGGFDVADPPRRYEGPEYGPNYYAIGFNDPDGIHLEVVFEPSTNPELGGST